MKDNCLVMKKSKGLVTIEFENAEDAAKLVEVLIKIKQTGSNVYLNGLIEKILPAKEICDASNWMGDFGY